MTTRKKKKGHGGLKFLAFLVIVGALITGIVKGSGSETGQRILGNREDLRMENTALTPRFAYASAKVNVSFASISIRDGAPEDFTLRRDISIDRRSARASTEISIGRTPKELATGVNAIPFDDFELASTEIMTKDYSYSRQDESKPWYHEVEPPYYYDDPIDPHYIPMIDDIMGYELLSLPTKPVAPDALSGFKAAGLKRVGLPAVDSPTESTSVTEIYSYEMDMATYRRAIPILAGQANFLVPAETPVTVTIGFDDVGLLRLADVAIAASTATTIAQTKGEEGHIAYHYRFEVTDISGEPITIEVPTNTVDQPPDDSVPAAPAG